MHVTITYQDEHAIGILIKKKTTYKYLKHNYFVFIRLKLNYVYAYIHT